MLITLTINNQDVRCFLDEATGEPWFCLRDMAGIIQYKSPHIAACRAGITLRKIHTPSPTCEHEKPMSYLSEDDMNTLVNHPAIKSAMVVHRQKAVRQIMAAYHNFAGPVKGARHA